MADVTPDDLRAAVAAGHLSEAQAASVLTLSQSRAGFRARMSTEDEPFELFRGFAEIFVTIGLSILFFAAFGMLALSGNALTLLVAVPLCAALAEYFTLRRRMVLPSILITTAFSSAIFAAITGLISARFMIFGSDLSDISTTRILGALGLTAGGLLIWFYRYRVPFTMFLIGLSGLAAILTATRAINSGAQFQSLHESLDLASGSGFGVAMLVFGVLALAAGIWFDMRDPYRLGRQSASGFWLHVLAAPALVNTIALTFWRMGPGTGYILLAVVLLASALLALVIDRRSFLTAGLGYVIFLVIWLFADESMPMSWLGTLLIIGIGLTALGAGWTGLRARVMRALPEFPGKHRLPPYAE